jgi:cellulose biosynthesis protein BcsQ
MAKVHLTMGAKGGIGKSFIAALMAQYLIDNVVDCKPVCIDLDFKNKTFSRYTGLDVNLLDVESNGDIDKSKFDVFINHIDSAAPDDIMIVDTGGNIYLALTDYLNSNAVLDLLVEMGNIIVMHVPVMSGADMFPTLNTLNELVRSTPAAVKAAVWINQKSGRVEYNGKTFEESDTYEELKDRIAAIRYIPLWRPDMQVNVAAMLEEAITFKAALTSPAYDLMGRQRLKMAQRYLYTAIERSGVLA